MRVYHFLSEQYGLDDIRHRRLKISRLQEMNDPFELLSAALPTRDHREALRRFAETVDDRWGVLCFSRNWKNPLLWSHYADRHRGLCLGFDIPRNRCLTVEYADSRLLLDIERQLSHTTRDELFGRKLLATKFKGWSYEDEVRAILSLDTADERTGLYFAAFGAQLRLREVVVGARSALTRTKLSKALAEQDKACKLIKARLAFNTFTVVRQKNEKLWA